MRVTLLAALSLLLAGCASTPSATDPTTDATLTPTAPTAPGETAPSAPPPPDAMGPRGAVVSEALFFSADGTMVPAAAAAGMAEGRVAHDSGPAGSFVIEDPVFHPWMGPAFPRSAELVGEVVLTLSFVSSAPAPSTTQPVVPGVGAWIGTNDRWSLTSYPSDSPAALEAGKVNTHTIKFALPQGGFFVRAGENLAVRFFLNYAPLDGSPISIVVGGAHGSSLAYSLQAFNFSAPREAVLADKSGEMEGATPAGGEPPTVDVPIVVPPDALAVIARLNAQASAGRVDLDLSVVAHGEAVWSAGSPYGNEQILVGPGLLAAHGRDLVLRVVAYNNPPGTTWTLQASTYSP